MKFKKIMLEDSDIASGYIGKLQPKYVAVLTAYRQQVGIGGRVYDMIAHRLGLNVGTVKSRLHRARVDLVRLRGSK